MDSIPDDKEAVPLKSQHHLVQVLDNLDELASAKRHQHAAFIRNDRSLVVWSDQVQDLVGQVQAVSQALEIQGTKNKKPGREGKKETRR